MIARLVALWVFLVPMTTAASTVHLSPSGADDWEPLQQALDRAGTGDRLELAAGTFHVSRPLVMARSRVVLQGAGIDDTVISADFTGRDGAVLTLGGQLAKDAPPTACSHTTAAADADTTAISPADADRFSPGDVLSLRIENDRAFLDQIGSKAWDEKYPFLRWTMNQVGASGIAADGRLPLAAPLGMRLPARARICRLAVLEGVRVAGLTLLYKPGLAADPDNYGNGEPDRMVDGLALRGVVAARIDDLRIVGAGRHPLVLDEALEVQVDRVALCGALNKGEGGAGYFRISRTYRSSFRHITVQGLRHIAIQWSSHDNDVHIAWTDTGIDFHGGWSQRNRVVVDHMQLRDRYPFPTSRRTPDDAHWAPPDGTGNEVEFRPSAAAGDAPVCSSR